MSPLAFSAGAATVLLILLAGFQFALALGAPWGRAAYGGMRTELSPTLRIVSAFAGPFWILVGLTLLRRAGAPVWAPLPDAALPAAGWVIVGLFAVGFVPNLISRSPIERAIWAPTCALAAVAATAVNLLADG